MHPDDEMSWQVGDAERAITKTKEKAPRVGARNLDDADMAG